MKTTCDIDIDCLNRDYLLTHIPHVVASRIQQSNRVKHNTGVYLQPVPCDPATMLANIDYTEAEERGYFKIDFLNVSAYEGVQDEDHLVKLINEEPMWELLEQDDFVNLLFHVNGHGDILRKTKPRTIEQLAAVLAMIRPAKRHLVGQSWDEILSDVWTKPTDSEYYWKKAHAISYATVVVMQMNLICSNYKVK